VRRQGAKRVSHVVDQRPKAQRQRRGPPNHDHVHTGWGDVPSAPIGFAQPAPSPVASHRSTDLAADGEARAAGPFAGTPQENHRRSFDSLALLEQRLELGASGEPFLAAQPPDYTVSRLRPFARRRFNVFRPPGVLIRSRKPCVFFRRRTFG
jgi:hypothetical protein